MQSLKQQAVDMAYRHIMKQGPSVDKTLIQKNKCVYLSPTNKMCAASIFLVNNEAREANENCSIAGVPHSHIHPYWRDLPIKFLVKLQNAHDQASFTDSLEGFKKEFSLHIGILCKKYKLNMPTVVV